MRKEQIISSIEALEAPAEKWTLTDILALLGPTAEFKDACQGLAILVQAEYAIFRSAALFVDEKMQSHRLSVEDVQRVPDEPSIRCANVRSAPWWRAGGKNNV